MGMPGSETALDEELTCCVFGDLLDMLADDIYYIGESPDDLLHNLHNS